MKKLAFTFFTLCFLFSFKLIAREVIICQLTNGCIDKNGDYLCCNIIKNTTCKDLTIYGMDGKKWVQDKDYSCTDVDGIIKIKIKTRINTIDGMTEGDITWDPNSLKVEFVPTDNTKPKILLADLTGIWNNIDGTLQVLQLYSSDSNTINLRVFTPVLMSPYSLDSGYKMMLPFIVSSQNSVFNFSINLLQLQQNTTTFNISPNPFNSVLNIVISNAANVYNYKLIITRDGIKQDIVVDLLSNNNPVNTSLLPSGNYYYLITDSSGSLAKSAQIIKQ